MIVDLLIVALAGAFAITAIERWIDVGWLRGVLAWGFAAGGVFLFDYRGTQALVLSMAAAFVALLALLVGERLASPPPIVMERSRTGL